MSLYSEHKQAKESVKSLFSDFQSRILNIDPVTFVEQNLTLDGKPFRLNGNGYKPFADIYRYIGLKAIEPGSKPVVLVKGRQVGATTMAAALECYFTACGLYGNSGRPPMRIMHAFPVIKLATAYVKDKLNPIISTSKPVPGAFKQNGMLKSFMECKLDTSSQSNDSQSFKKFLGGNQVWIESTGLNGDRLRGLTIDCLFMDEYQDMFKEAVGAASKILSQAKYGTPSKGVRVYFGTPKTKGGMYWDTWQSSTQQYYHLKCEKCNSYFPLYRPDVNWEDIWLYGFIVKCTDCGHEQDKRQAAEYGKWIALNNEDDSSFIGYHINQLYIPTFPKEAIIGEKPENNPHNSERTYMNEVLGEFFDGEGGTVSVEEIREKCGDTNLRMVDRIYSTEKRMYAGFDWGQKAMLDQLAGKKQGRSYSCGVILSADGPSLFSVNFAMRFKKNRS